MKHFLSPLAIYVRLCLVGAILLGLLPWLAQPASGSPSAPAEITLTASDNGRSVELRAGQILVLELPANPSTGYLWDFDLPAEGPVRQIGEPLFVPASNLLGAPGTVTLRLAPVRDGTIRLALAYHRPWEDAHPLRTFGITIHAVGRFDPAAAVVSPDAAVVDPIKPPLTAAIAATDGEQSTTGALPTTFNWCDHGGCTPVRNQGACGSCWAFATVGPLESLIKLNGGGDKDLSEQYLVSCNTDGWGCDGGWWAHDYHQWKYRIGEPGPGAVYEAEMPYYAADLVCNPPHPHHELIDYWNEIEPHSWVPSVDAIKQAIHDHGPVSAAICVGSAFDRYGGGIFSTHESCRGTVNHGIVLVGWDDNLGVWYLRNSWGPDWGEDGYMRIAYGTSLVGYGAAYIDYGIVPRGPAAPVNLTAATTGTSIDLAWTDNSADEDGFKIERSFSAPVRWQEIATVGVDVTSYVDTGAAAGVHNYYRVRAYNGLGDSSYTNEASAFIPGDFDNSIYLPLSTRSGGVVQP